MHRRYTVEELVNSNICPSQEERTHVLEVIANDERRVLRVSDEMREVILKPTFQLSKHGGLLKAALKTLKSHRAILAPIRRLPPEMISRVFMWYPMLNNKGELHVPSLEGQSPFKLTVVCRMWRRIAFASPHLWCSFRVSPLWLNCEEPRWHGFLGAIQEWMNSTGQYPITFDLCCDGALPLGMHRTDIFIKTISQYTHRWQNITGNFPQVTAIHAFNAIAHGAPALRTIQLNVLTKSDEEQDPYFFDLSTAPAVNKIAIEALLCYFNFRTTNMSNLTHLTVTEGLSMQNFLHVLKYCPSIPEIDMFITEGLPEAIGVNYPILDHSVRKLDLRTNIIDVDLGQLLDRIRLPEVLDLSLAMETREVTHWPHLLNFLRRSFPPLNRLSLNNVPIAEPELLAVLAATPVLTILTLDDLDLSDGIFYALTPSAAPDGIGAVNVLLPMLDDFWFQECRAYTREAIAGMIVARWRCARQWNETTQAENIRAETQGRLASPPQPSPVNNIHRVRLRVTGDHLTELREIPAVAEFVKQGLQVLYY
ncbi:hypothetical protein BD410DRAFT_898083 [Rickenella mellea]|uniref:Uncharacterized protein n=1 Tax=Rickenella mellea TaxID=50990 RepID=A0A4Y7Q7Q4_9AGAM|nr:hypothetical protein BD410DRAFT_898083 [Rickenella mellea]